jgi:hypothetical protein
MSSSDLAAALICDVPLLGVFSWSLDALGRSVALS